MDTGIRLAAERDIPALTEIWKICFRDPDEYIRFFYRENFEYISAAVYTVDDKPVSMLHWFESSFVNGPQRKDAKFLYAGGTLPDHRKKGYYSALFEYVKSMAVQNGFLLFGKPASRELIPSYLSLGFRQDACLRLVTVRPEAKIPLSFFPLTPEEYNRMRDRAFSVHPYAKWPDRYVRWCCSDHEWFGGKTLSFEMDGDVYFLMGAPEEGALLITETNLSLAQLHRASGALCAFFGTRLVKAYLPDYSCSDGLEIVSSIVYNTPLLNTYVNLILS